MNPTRVHAIMSGAEQTATAQVLRAGLGPAAWGYGQVVAARNWLFDRGWRPAARLERPVVSVGNITAGGTGKTPMVVALAQRLIGLGAQPAVLMRGYRGGGGGSDEANVLAAELGAMVPIAVSPRRAAAAAEVLAHRPDVSVFLLDDGFQHRQVQRDLDLVLIDATQPLGFGRLLPRGLLREPAANLRRAGAVIVTRADQVEAAVLAEVDKRVEELTGRAPVAHAAHAWIACRDGEGRSLSMEDARAFPVHGVCGIGNPEAFAQTLRAQMRVVTGVAVYGDHHAYTAADVQTVAAAARAAGARAILTTGKDWAKLEALAEGFGMPVLRPVLRIGFLDGEESVMALLRQALGK